MTLGQCIRERRESNGWTGVDLAERLGVSRAMVSAVEHGHKTIALKSISKWARALGVEQLLLVRLALQRELRTKGLSYVVEVRQR